MIKYMRSLFKKPLPIKQSWVEEPTKFSSMEKFLNWFDATTGIEETVKKAELDWKERLTNFTQFSQLNKGACLEIGFGGGRLLEPASQTFSVAHGIDIHAAFDMTRKFLSERSVSNYRLLTREESETLPEGSVDFVYSFIVFQHFDTIDEVDYYLDLIKRVLSTDGFAHIFFGKLSSGEGAICTEPKDFVKRACSLFVEPELFHRKVREHGFEIVTHEEIMPKRLGEPLCADNESGQARVLFRKV